jgi:hypothetical protein
MFCSVCVQADRIRAIERVQADQVRVEKRAAAARARGRGTAPPAPLKLLFAVPALRTRGARSNAYGPFPPQLDESVLAS